MVVGQIKQNLSTNDKVFHLINTLFLSFVFLITLYPLLYIISSSLSSIEATYAGKVWLYPIDITLKGYTTVFGYKGIWTAYYNSFFYAVTGTTINLFMTITAAYALSRKDFKAGGTYIKLFTFTMIFQAGLIPNYLLISRLGLINTRWVMIIPTALNIYNLIITRTFFRNTIPDELLDAARIDGSSDIQFLVRIVLPISGAIIAVNTLFYAVQHWNTFLNAFIYLNDEELYPLQIILRKILILNTFDGESLIDEEAMEAMEGLNELLKYSIIIVSSLPVLIMYPFVQKFFVKGVMLGSVKG